MQIQDHIDAVPAARTADIVTTASEDEVLVYDQTAHRIHHLDAVTSHVWSLCDGQRTIDDVARAAGVDGETARLALRELENVNLLEGPMSPGMPGAQSRRVFMKRAAAAGAVAVPAIVSIAAPRAAAASSGRGGPPPWAGPPGGGGPPGKPPGGGGPPGGKPPGSGGPPGGKPPGKK